MSILFRYLGGQILGAIALALLILALLFSFFDLIGELNDVHMEGYTPGLALLYVSIRLPGRVHELLPIAALVGTLFALARLAINSEFTVMRASGLSVRRLAGFMFVLGGLLGLATLLIGEYAVPPSERAAQQLKLRGKAKIVAGEFRSGIWAKDGQAFINIKEMRPDGSLHGMRIYGFDKDFQLLLVRSAETGRWSAQGQWLLENVTETRLTANGTEIQKWPKLNWQSAINPDLLSVLMVNPERMAISSLYSYIGYLNENKQKATRYEVALWSKLAFPVAMPIMLLLALPFAYQPPRRRGVGGKILIGILIGLSFHLLNRLSGHIGMLNEWPPMLSAVIPLAVFSLAAALALWRAERR